MRTIVRTCFSHAHLLLSCAGVAEHVVAYHDTWNQTTVQQIVRAYPSADYATEAYRLVQCATDFAFRCGTRLSARLTLPSLVNS